MEFYKKILNKEITLFYIDEFDVGKWYDANQLKNIYKCLFSQNDILFFSFKREENLTEEKELIRLRNKIVDIFNDEGEYVVLKKIDSARFDSVARITVKESTFDLLIDIWNYFYSCNFFIPSTEFTFSDFILFQQNIKFQDRGGEKLLQKKYSDFECLKGLGGDSLIISYRSDFSLPDLKKAALDTLNTNQLFR